MIRDIITDSTILCVKSVNHFYRETHRKIEKDLIATATAHEDECDSLSAIQIGEAVRLFVIKIGDEFVPFRNPHILMTSDSTYTVIETCLSCKHEHKVLRHEWIKVMYEDSIGRVFVKTLGGSLAQLFEHEYDHLNGKIFAEE